MLACTQDLKSDRASGFSELGSDWQGTLNETCGTHSSFEQRRLMITRRAGLNVSRKAGLQLARQRE